MKKALSAVLAVVLVLGVCFSVPMVVSATNADKFEYTLNNDGTGYIITGHNGELTGVVTIPKDYTLGDGKVINATTNKVENAPISPANALTAQAPVVALPTVEGATVSATYLAADAEEGTDPTDVTEESVPATSIVTVEVEVTDNTKEIDEVTVTNTTTPEATVTVTDNEDGTYTFTMPEGDVSVEVTLKDKVVTPTTYNVNVGTVTGGTVTVDPTTAAKDATVTVTATPENAETHQVTAITVVTTNGDPVTVTGNTFTMPASDVTVTATFGEIQKYAITLDDVDNGIGLNLDEALNSEAKAGQTVNVYITADLTKYIISGIKVTYGDNQTVQATAIQGELPTGVVAGYSFAMPASEVKVEPVFAYTHNAITVATLTNGAIEIEGTKNAEDKYENNKSVTLTVKPAKGYKLSKLTVDNEVVAVNEAGEYTFTMPAKEVAVSAEFVVATLPVLGVAEGAFAGCTGISEFKLAEGQTNVQVVDGVLFDGTTLLAFPGAIELEADEDETEVTYTIPSTVKRIAKNAFVALGNVDYVFYAGELYNDETAPEGLVVDTADGSNAALMAEKVFHYGMTTHTIAADDEGVVTLQPNCTYTGIRTYYCAICGEDNAVETVVEDIPENPTHVLGDWYTVNAADCTEDGEEAQDCVLCNELKVNTRPIEALGHTEPADWDVTDATCGVQGVKVKDCTVCGAELEKETIPALTHEITDNGTNENITAKKDATCEEAGFVTGNCDHCGNVVTITYEKLTHKYIEVVDAEVTCTVNGWQHEECEYCGEYKEGSDMELKAPGHIAASVKDENDNFVTYKWTVVKAPTCSEDGFAEVRCENCGIQMVDPEGEIEYTRVLPATGKHDFKDYTETKAATCDEEGEKTGTCACGATDVVEIPALGHKWAEEYTVDTPATCTKKGSESVKCTVCGDKNENSVRETALAEHTADDTWTTVQGKEATCYAEGQKTGTCAVCKATNCLLPIEKLEHKWAAEAINLKADIEGTIQATNEDGTPKVDEDGKPVMVAYTYKAPTCEDEGYQAIYCTNKDCPASIIKEGSLVKVDALGHDYDDTYNTDIPANKAATCKEAGYMFKWCKTCSEANKANENKGYVKIELAQKAHEYEADAEILREDITIKVPELDDNGKVVLGNDGNPVMVDKVVSAPDCENPGYTAVYCKNYETCGEYKDVTAAEKLGHKATFAEWTKDSTPATCTTKAFETNTCSRCNETMRQDVGDFAACVFETEYTFDYPTCEEAGRKYYKCSNDDCDKISGEVVLEALGHTFATDAKFVGTDATCTTDGVKVKECLNCFEIGTGKPYEEPETDDTGDENTPATQTEGDSNDGNEGGTTTTTRPAAPDGYEYCAGYTVITPATGHAFSDEYTEDLAATCETAGSESRHCTNEDCDATTGSRAIAKLGHNYSTEYKVVTPATCQAEGKEARYCLNEDCESYTGERKLAKADHSYDEANGWVVDTRATCTTKGSKHVDCKVCGAAGRKTAEIAALGHDVTNATLQTTHATCLADGETYKLCERIVATTGEDGAVTYAPCNEKVVIEELKATGHNVENWNTEADPATCTEAGTKTGTCTNERCPNTGKQVTETVPALGHKYVGEPTRVDPTCYSTGSLTGTCTVCELTNAVQVLPMIDHTWGDWELADGATSCKEENALVSKCTAKGCTIGVKYSQNEEHTESGWILEEDATCSTNGRMYTECTVCKSEIKSQTLYATNAHDYEEDVEERVEPTCNTAGSKTLVCKNCAKVTKETIAATDHTFTEWKVFVEPTCTEKGIRQSVCTVCLTTKSEKILANGHTESDWIVTEPTCTTVGEKHKECTVCKEVIAGSSVELEALGHNYTTSNTCSAKDCDAQLYEYKLIGESTTDIEIVKYNPDAKNVVENVVIPSEIDGYVVKAIGDRAFMKIVDVPGAIINEETGERAQTTTKCEKSQFTTVTIPETVTTIGDYAFASASDNFKSVVIPGTVETIGDYAFGYNVELNWIADAEAEVEVGETRPLIESTPIIKGRVEDFAIYGVKDSAAAVYAAQKADDTTDDFKFAAIADIYEVAIPEEFTEVAEKADDNVVLFKEFVVYEENDENKKSIEEQIEAVVDINVSGYSVEVVSSQSYEPVDEDGNVIEENCKYFYGTGTKVLVKEGNNVVDVIEIVVQGDVNGDGAVDAIDCMLIQLAAADNSTRPLEGVYYTAGNITADTVIDANDFSAAVDKIFGEDLIVEDNEETTAPSTSAPTTTEPTTEAPASTEPSTEGTSESTSEESSESTPAESTSESTPAESTSESTPAESTSESTPAASEPASDTPAA